MKRNRKARAMGRMSNAGMPENAISLQVK